MIDLFGWVEPERSGSAVPERRTMKAAFASILVPGLLAGLIAGTAAAEDGSLNAAAFENSTLPPGTAVSLRLYDNSDENLQVLKTFESALQSKGYIVSDGAPLVINIDTSKEVGAWSTGDRRTLVQLETTLDRADGTSDSRAHMSLFNSQTGGVFNPGNEDRTNIVTPSSYRLEATLDDRRDGRHLWQGWAIANAGAAGGGTGLLQAMVPIVVGALGKTVKQEPFSFVKQ
jgi:hypothetical protein